MHRPMPASSPSRPVVLLHGWGGSFAATWAASGWVEELAEAGRCVFAVDLPGHGEAASPEPASYGDLTAALAERLPPGELDIVGFSLGAKLALALTARQPDRVHRLVIGGVGDNLFQPEPDSEVLAAAVERGANANTPPGIAALVEYAAAAGNNPQALAAVLRRPPNPVLTEQDMASVGDVLLVNGCADAIALPDKRLRAALGRPDYLALPGVDHLGLPSHPAFRRVALSLLDIAQG